MGETSRAELRLAPGLAGGPLRTWNRILQFLARHPRGRLVLDDRRATSRDRDLLLWNGRDPLRLPGPPDGRFRSAAERERLLGQVRRRVPLEATVAFLEEALPRPGEGPEEAGLRLWRRLLRDTELEVVAGDRPGGDPLPPPQEIVWVPPDLAALLREAGLEPRLALAGERALREAWRPPDLRRLEAALGKAEAAFAKAARDLARTLEGGPPSLAAAWTRLRRRQREDLRRFRGRLREAGRRGRSDPGGILHHAAQLLRPQGHPQEDGLGLAAAWEALELRRAAPRLLAQRLAALSGPGPVLLDPVHAAVLAGGEK